MRLRQFNILVAIVENGLNITAAAEKLHTSQPGVSKQLKLLEEELGLRIFTRKGKSLEGLTPEGEEVLRRARLILAEASAIKGMSQKRYEEEDGTLSIATTHTQARYVLPEVVNRFREHYPRVRLDMHQGTTEQIANMAAEHQVDFAIATGSEALFPDWVLLPCYRWDRSIIVPRDHPLADAQGQLSLEILADYPLVTYVFSTNHESSLLKAFREAGLKPNVAFTARDADVIKTYVRMGLGVGVVASMASGCDEDLVALDGEGLFPRCTTWLGFTRDLVWRQWMYEFVEQFAPQWDRTQIARARECATHEEAAALVEDKLPLRALCNNTPDPTR